MTLGKFGPSSRYLNTPVASRTGPDGQRLRYLRRRLMPDPKAEPLGFHAVSDGDRIDRIAARTLGDPLLWWRLADTNLALDPADLTATVGRTLRIAVEADPPPPQPEDGSP